MNLCDDGHDEVCFEGRARDCPVCLVIKEKREYETQIDELERELAKLENTLMNQ